MPEPAVRSSRLVSILFAAICIGGVAAVIYFAHSAAVQAAPAYSTLDTKPDGAKLLFDSLKEARLVQVSRQFKSVGLQKVERATVFFLGVEPEALTTSDLPYFDEMEGSAKAGNRLVIAVTDNAAIDLSFLSKARHELSDRWGIRFIPIRKTNTTSIDVDKSWTALPEYGTDVWQRYFGKGSIILVGEALRLTNKGVASSERNRHLFQQLIANCPSAVFEEAHLGIRETGSIAGLARHYHLQGLVAGLILLAALFVWNRSVNFPPPLLLPEKTLLGADTRSMLAELMSRHLKGELIAACVAEWNRTRAHAPAIHLSSENNPVVAYTKIQESLASRTIFKI